MSDDSEQAAIDIEGIKRLIPHRYPFLLVDRIIEVQGATQAIGIKNVTINEQIFQGHFPEMAVFPGVLQLEAMEKSVKTQTTLILDETMGPFPILRGVKPYLNIDSNGTVQPE